MMEGLLSFQAFNMSQCRLGQLDMFCHRVGHFAVFCMEPYSRWLDSSTWTRVHTQSSIWLSDSTFFAPRFVVTDGLMKSLLSKLFVSCWSWVGSFLVTFNTMVEPERNLRPVFANIIVPYWYFRSMRRGSPLPVLGGERRQMIVAALETYFLTDVYPIYFYFLSNSI